jgi:hypothetical protein
MKITRKLLLSLGFNEEKVSMEQSGSTPFKYFSLNHRNGNTFLITCANDDCKVKNNYIVEFFNEEDAGYIDDAETLETLCGVLKKLK